MLPDRKIPLESVLVTSDLARRPPRAPNYELQCAALEELSAELASSPSSILTKLAEVALRTCRAGSAGMSLLSEDAGHDVFRWPAIAGEWASKTGGTLPFDASPCGVVVTEGATQLFHYPERHYQYGIDVDPPICEALLEPFFENGEPIGTIWLIAHDEQRQFDQEDARMLACLGRFAGRAFQVLRSIESLEPSKQRLAAIIEGCEDAIISKNLDGIVTSWNAGAERLFGYPASEAIGRSITMLIPEDRLAEEATILQRIRRGQRIDPFETIRRKKDGSPIEISLTISPIMNTKREIVGASKIARDISDQKRIERALIDADRQKNEFLATLAHELRNPLAPIRTSLGVLGLLQPVDERVSQLQEVMDRQVNHMVRLVDDLLEIARIATGRIDLHRQRIDVATLIRNAVETSRPLIDSAQHHLTVSLPPHPLTVNGDMIRLSQVVSNLLNNSAKYTDPGGTIDLTVTSDGAEVTISVRDNGIGISPETLPDVLNPFAQVHRNFRNSHGGLGIGLSIVQRLVDLHHGSVEVRSEGEGRGSEFLVRLPLARHPVPSAPSDRLHAPDPIPSQLVLVVDDNKDAASSLGQLLRALGCDVRTAFSGAEALEVIKKFQPTVMLLDLGMPGMSGFDVARHVRNRPELAEVIIAALTGWGQEEDRRKTREAGFNHHLVKPVSLDELQRLLASTPVTGCAN